MTTPTISGSAPGAAGAPAAMISGDPAAAAHLQAGRPPAPTPTAPPLPVPRFQYAGVRPIPAGGWAAHVLVDPERHAYRTVGPFPDAHAAALAHDRVAIAFLGDRARANFRPAFHPIEQRFLRLCRTRDGEIDVCTLVADGMYEARYATFLRAVLGLERWGEYLGVVLDFFLDRAAEIGREALEEGGEKLAARFVEMHRNKAVDPRWRAWYLGRVAAGQKQRMERERQQLLQQQQRGGGCASASAMQHQQQQVP
jgi:hypothetical protein